MEEEGNLCFSLYTDPILGERCFILTNSGTQALEAGITTSEITNFDPERVNEKGQSDLKMLSTFVGLLVFMSFTRHHSGI